MPDDSLYLKPLSELNVVDFGHYYSGPMVGMTLADQGANVIHIEQPDGPELASQQYRLLHRNKNQLKLDLKTEEGRQFALDLIEKADVVIENFRPGVMKRLGLDYASVKNANPGLIYLSLPGFPSTDKERAPIQAWEGVVSAAMGTYTHMHLQRHALDFPPVYSWVPLLSVYAGLNGVIAVMAALLAREEHGVGTVLEVPMADAAHISLIRELLFQTPDRVAGSVPELYKPMQYHKGDSAEVIAEKLEKAGQEMLTTMPTEAVYECADGKTILVGTFFMRHLVGRFIKAIGLEQKLKQEGFVNEGMFSVALDNNLSNASQLSNERRYRLAELIKEAFKTKTADEWETILAEAGVMVAVVRTRTEWMALDPLMKGGVFAKQKDGSAELVVPGRVGSVGLWAQEGDESFGEAAYIDTATADSLFTPRKQTQMGGTPKKLKKGDLLKGVKVVDMSNVLAGPVGGWTLAGYGADVVKLDHTESYSYPLIIVTGLIITQGKRSIIVDMKTAAGRKVFEQLVAGADLVTHNVVGDTALRLGVSQDQLEALNPDIVSCQLSCFGGTRQGGWENRVGFDGTAQAACGIIEQYDGGHGAGKTADIVAGFCQAFTSILGLYVKRKTGKGCVTRTSLAQAINYSQLPFAIAENGSSDWGEPRGQLAVGPAPWQRLYECGDGWVFAGAREKDAAALAELVTGQPGGDEEAMVAAFAEDSASNWQDKLLTAGFGCHVVRSADDIYDQAAVRAVPNETGEEQAADHFEVITWENHPCGRSVSTATPSWVRVGEDHSYLRLAPAPRIGEQTPDILRELGYGDEEIETLIRIKAVHEYLPILGQNSYFSPGDSFAGYGVRK